MSISAAVTALRPTIERLAEFAALSSNWDSYGGLPASPRAVSAATELLVLLADYLPDLDPERLVPFAVAPIADGGVQLEWRRQRHDLEVEIAPGGELGYLLIERLGDRREFREESNVLAREVLRLLGTLLVRDPPE